MPRWSTLLIVGLCLLLLLIGGLLFGEIGSALFGIESPSWISQHEPQVHLPAGELTNPISLGPLGDFSITNTLLASWLTMVFLIGLFYLANRKSKLVPGRLQALAELGVEKLLNFCQDVAGEENGRKFFPVVATIFLFVMFNAYLALLPFFGAAMHVEKASDAKSEAAGKVESVIHVEEDHPAHVEEGDVICRLDNGEEIVATTHGEIEHLDVHVGDDIAPDTVVASIESEEHFLRSASTDLNLPIAMALIAVFFVEYWGMRALGGRKYLSSNFFNFGKLFRSLREVFSGKVFSGLNGMLTGFINAFVGLLEIVSHFGRVISFSFRLFGNMTAGEILLGVMAFLVPFLMPLPFYGLELLVGFIQAL